MKKASRDAIIIDMTKIMEESQTIKIEFSDTEKKKIVRQAKILKPDINDEEINEIMDNPEKGTQNLMA